MLIQFPLHLVAVSEGQSIMLELKSGDTYNGKLKGVDAFMNVNLGDCICTSKVFDC